MLNSDRNQLFLWKTSPQDRQLIYFLEFIEENKLEDSEKRLIYLILTWFEITVHYVR